MGAIFHFVCLILCAQATLVLTAAITDQPKYDKVHLAEENNSTKTMDLQTPNKHQLDYDMMDFLGLGEQRNHRLNKHLSLANSASQFLLEIYERISDADTDDLSNLNVDLPSSRSKREAIMSSALVKLPMEASHHYAHNSITQRDQVDIDKSNNIITFSSKAEADMVSNNSTDEFLSHTLHKDMRLMFNVRNIPRDLKLVDSTMRIYLKPRLQQDLSASVSLYQLKYTKADKHHHRNPHKEPEPTPLRLVFLDTITTSSLYRGWLEFNTSKILGQWIKQRDPNPLRSQLIVRVNVLTSEGNENVLSGIHPNVLGLIPPPKVAANQMDINADTESLRPFMIGYFNGPAFHKKIHNLKRKKRDLEEKVLEASKASEEAIEETPTNFSSVSELLKWQPLVNVSQNINAITAKPACARHNFTVDFEDIYKSEWVIAPERFEAYYCGGDCMFPLSDHMNATNHAIVQTLMHVKFFNLPKSCCVPTELATISVLHFVNEDSVNLVKYPKSVARACGCH